MSITIGLYLSLEFLYFITVEDYLLSQAHSVSSNRGDLEGQSPLRFRLFIEKPSKSLIHML